MAATSNGRLLLSVILLLPGLAVLDQRLQVLAVVLVLRLIRLAKLGCELFLSLHLLGRGLEGVLGFVVVQLRLPVEDLKVFLV